MVPLGIEPRTRWEPLHYGTTLLASSWLLGRNLDSSFTHTDLAVVLPRPRCDSRFDEIKATVIKLYPLCPFENSI